MALAQLGRAVVRQGRVDEGVALLDEAMAVALGGETSDPLACGDACCTTLVVCDGLADLRAPSQWCELVVEFTERRRFTPVQSWCRAIYGGYSSAPGDWGRAEPVLTEALERRADRRRGGGHVLPLATLAELRLRQGRGDEAERLLAGSRTSPRARAARGAGARTRRSRRSRGRCSTAARRRRPRCWPCAARSSWPPATSTAAAARAARLRDARRRPRARGPRRRGGAAGGPRRGGPRATPRPRRRSSRTRSPASARSASRSTRRARGSRSPAPGDARLAARARLRAAARDAFERLGARRTPTGPPRCCASSAPPAARPRAASATS